MRILLVNDYGVLAGGAERVTADLRDGLRARGHGVRLLASTASPIPLANDAEYRCYGTNAAPQRFLQVWNPFAVRALRGALAGFRPDIVHVRMFLTQLSPAILPLLARTPAILHAGNHQLVCPINSKVLPDGTSCALRPGIACLRSGCVSPAGVARTVLQQAALRRRLGVFRAVVANSRALADTLSAGGVEVDEVIGNGTTVVPPRPHLAGRPLIACAGRLVPLKGADDLIAAMAIVRREVPGAHLLVAGDGPDRPRLERLVAGSPAKEAITMVGHRARPELDEFMSAAWVQVMPSRFREPFANAVAEAMMRGTAVVATATGGTPELEGKTGYLVPPGDPGALAERIIRLVQNRELAESMGAAARAVALRDLTLARMVDRFEAVYDRVLADSSGD